MLRGPSFQDTAVLSGIMQALLVSYSFGGGHNLFILSDPNEYNITGEGALTLLSVKKVSCCQFTALLMLTCQYVSI